MACSAGSVTTGVAKPKISVCVGTTTKDVNVTLEGETTESWPFSGYVRFRLKRSPKDKEVWYDVATKDGGKWENSAKGKKNFTFSNIGYKGDTMVVYVDFYANSNYTGKFTSDASHMFIR